MKMKVNKIPELRFSGFMGEYANRSMSNVLTRISDAVDVTPKEWYQEIGIRSHGKGVFHKDPVQGKTLGNKRVFWIKPDVFILNIVFAWEQAIAKTTTKEVGMIASHRFPMFGPKNGISDISYFLFFFLTKKGKHLLGLASPGGAGRNKTLGQNAFNKLKIFCPPLPEQQKIASFLSAVDKKIEQLTRKKELLEQYKKGVMQKLFSQEIRFKDENEQDFPDWKEKPLSGVFDTIPTKLYQIKNSEILNSGSIPVIDQGQKDIAGFSEEKSKLFKNQGVIVYGDHTTILKYVDFDFVIGADGTKLLTSKKGDLKYFYYNLLFNNVKPEGYRRHYSLLKKVLLQIPHKKEQQKIANFLSSIDDKINTVQSQLIQTQNFKKGLLQKMFI